MLSHNRKPRSYDDILLISYDAASGTFSYLAGIEQLTVSSESRPFWELLKADKIVDDSIVDELKAKMESLLSAKTAGAFNGEYKFIVHGEEKWYRVNIVCFSPDNATIITLTDISSEIAERFPVTDELTGLYNRSGFDKAVEMLISEHPEVAAAGGYAMVYFDIIRFKAINDIFGMEKGDRLLKFLAHFIMDNLGDEEYACRNGSDRFVFFMSTTDNAHETLIKKLLSTISEYDLPFEIAINAGIYVTSSEQLSCNAMIDRAILAQSSIKGSYTVRYKYYTEELRNDMLGEQEIVGMMSTALAEKQFIIHYQPQYNHSTGMLVGAEALVRWKHPEKGIISPGVFIPIFERNGFITNLDMYVFEQVCDFQHRCLEKKLPVVPISSNFSRYDIFHPDFVDNLEKLRKKYDVPVKFLRIELTESAVVGGTQHTNDVIKRLHDCGYIVEMDDFGSGYSSLNVLKDIDLDIIKLDMQFLSERSESNKGGTILSSVVRMAKWLSMPIIAEGVESVAQADFLRSIGCDYIQGYLYSKPIPEEEYLKIISSTSVGATVPQMRLIETLNAFDFWNPKSQETLIFSNYVGGAALFDYHDGKVEMLRVNQKYLQEISMNLSEKELIESDPLSTLDDENKQIYLDMLSKAIQTGEEQECETWRTITSECCGEEVVCLRSTIRMVGKSDNSYLFHAMIRNITAEKMYYNSILDSEKRFKAASEQVKIYYWDYIIATKEMHPCFRCMRDLGVPPLVTNYPEPLIENGTFPPDWADTYRDWIRQIDKGAPGFEAIIPLTEARIPFHVRLTTEYDENGRAVKAYGSAALVVD